MRLRVHIHPVKAICLRATIQCTAYTRSQLHDDQFPRIIQILIVNQVLFFFFFFFSFIYLHPYRQKKIAGALILRRLRREKAFAIRWSTIKRDRCDHAKSRMKFSTVETREIHPLGLHGRKTRRSSQFFFCFFFFVSYRRRGDSKVYVTLGECGLYFFLGNASSTSFQE